MPFPGVKVSIVKHNKEAGDFDTLVEADSKKVNVAPGNITKCCMILL